VNGAAGPKAAVGPPAVNGGPTTAAAASPVNGAEEEPLLLGREGFFDAFGIYFDKKNLQTSFDW
jgi:hypothetical protein